MNINLVITSVQLLLGAVIAFYGANLLRDTPALGGFILGGLVGMMVAAVVLPPGALNKGIGFVAGGVVGALIALPLQIVIIVISSVALGVLAGGVLGFLIGKEGISRMVIEGIFSRQQPLTTLQVWIMVLGGLVFGGLSVRFEDGMLIASTGFLGAFAVVTALGQLVGPSTPFLVNPIFQFFGWAAIGLFGSIWQSNNRGG